MFTGVEAFRCSGGSGIRGFGVQAWSWPTLANPFLANPFVLLMCVGGPPDAGPPLRKAPLHRTAQNFALFFPLPSPFRSVSLSGSLLVEFWCFWKAGTSNVHVWLLGCRVKPRRLRGRQRETKRAKMGAGEEKQSATFWGHPPFRARFCLGLGPTFLGPHHDTHQIHTWIGQKWIGQNWFWPKLAGPKPFYFKTH